MEKGKSENGSIDINFLENKAKRWSPEKDTEEPVEFIEQTL